MSACSSCGATIKWFRTEASGRMMPVDPQQVDGGNIVVVDMDGTTPICRVLPHESHREGLGYVSHFSSCPSADRHRKKR